VQQTQFVLQFHLKYIGAFRGVGCKELTWFWNRAYVLPEEDGSLKI